MNSGTLLVLENRDENFEIVPDVAQLAGVTNDFRREHIGELLNLPSN